MGGKEGLNEGWEDAVVGQTEEVYGSVTRRGMWERDWVTRRVLEVRGRGRVKEEGEHKGEGEAEGNRE